jgi:hypothetical protein
MRITRPGGLVLVYVWAFEQKQRKFKQQDVFVPWKMDKKYVKRPDQVGVGSGGCASIVFTSYTYVLEHVCV